MRLGVIMSDIYFFALFFICVEMLEYSDERSPWESMEDKLTLIRYAHKQEGSSEMCFWLLLHLFLSASDVREGELKSNA